MFSNNFTIKFIGSIVGVGEAERCVLFDGKGSNRSLDVALTSFTDLSGRSQESVSVTPGLGFNHPQMS